jgi:AraC-like DNA-binding protein
MGGPTMPGTISARMVLRVVEACRARGHDADALCRSAGLSPSLLAEPDARVPYALARDVGELALALSADPDFGLSLAQDVGDSRHYDAGVLFLMASPTVRVALERMAAHQRYWGDGDRARLFPVAGGLGVRYAILFSDGQYARHADECAMAEIAIGVRALSGSDLRPRVVRFRHAAPPKLDEHRKIFQCDIEFRSADTEIVFDDAVLDARMQHANEAFSAIFEQQVQSALARLPAAQSTSEHVRVTARAALAGGSCTLAGTARVLGLSARTLQRRLREEGTSFAQVVDLLRRELAVAYLERRIPIPEIAALLGYSDETAFHHAFNRWTGSSPARYAPPRQG